jgi:hypothetical protein
MNDKSLAWEYGNAVYFARRWQRRAEILLNKLEATALEEAEIDSPAAVQTADAPNQREDVSPTSDAPITIQHYVGPLADLSPLDLRKGAKYSGLLKRAGQSIGIHRTSVNRVATGERVSDRIMQAIVAERQRIDSIQHAETPPLTAGEHSQFRRGGRYYGLTSAIAKELRLSDGHVSRVRTGEERSARVLAAIRAGMARIDGKQAAKNGAQS